MARAVFVTDQNVICAVDDNGNLIPLKANVDGSLIIDSSATVVTNKHRVYTPVTAGDIGANYVSGSEGMIKTIKEYDAGAVGGSPAVLTTYKYQNATYPTFITDEVESATTV